MSGGNADADVDVDVIEKNLEGVFLKIVETLETKNETKILRTEDLFDEDPAQ